MAVSQETAKEKFHNFLVDNKNYWDWWVLCSATDCDQLHKHTGRDLTVFIPSYHDF